MSKEVENETEKKYTLAYQNEDVLIFFRAREEEE
jgi:hypothetical protein